MNCKIFFSFYLSFFFFYSANAFNITSILGQYPDFSSFSNYLTQTQLASQINSRQAITVLAVDNGALSPISGKPMDVLAKILGVHVVLDYYDVDKLQNLKTALLSTLFQASGRATGQQGFLNVTHLDTGGVVFGSAVSGSTLGAKLVKSIATQPYNISILQISTVIIPTGIDNSNSTNSPSPTPAPTASPNSTNSAPPTPVPAASPGKAITPPTPTKAPSPSPEISNGPAPSMTMPPLPNPIIVVLPPSTGSPPAQPPATDTGIAPTVDTGVAPASDMPDSPPMPVEPTAYAPAADAPAPEADTANVGTTFRPSLGGVFLVVSFASSLLF